MTEYINREALIAEYDRVHKGPAGGARKLMIEAPAADVIEVVHGRWIEGKTLEKCSVCGKKGFPDWKYCPNCGAKMDGGKE